jgi:hypothetical protein
MSFYMPDRTWSSRIRRSRRLRLWTALGLLAGLAAGWGVVVDPASGANESERPRILDIRFGHHPTYDRLVIELEGEASVIRWPETALGLVIEIGARPLLSRQVLDSGLPRIGVVLIDTTSSGASVRIRPAKRRVRAFKLRNPSRLVVDFADPGPAAFEAPRGTQAVVAADPARQRPLAPRQKPSPPKPRAKARPAARPAPPPVPAPVPAPTQQTRPQQTRPQQARPQPEPSRPVERTQPVERPTAQRAPITTSPTPSPTRPPTTSPRPAPRTQQPVQTPAVPSIPTRSTGSESASHFLSQNLSNIALWSGLALLLVSAMYFVVRGVRGLRPPSTRDRAILKAVEVGSDSITPDDLASPVGKLDLLEKRVDDEVRARMRLEEKLLHLQEELKVMRDRMQRLLRRNDEGT